MKVFYLILLSYLGCSFSLLSKGEEKCKYVNPFIGTAPTLQLSNWDGHGRTYPGAVAPFGFIQLSPETSISHPKGYDYRDTEIYFFSCFGHLSGYPNGSSGQGKIMPVENYSSLQANTYKRPFSHKNENAKPGYYKVIFEDNGTSVETSTATRSGMFRFTYRKNIKPSIFIGDLEIIELEGATVKGKKRNCWIEFSDKWLTAEKSGNGYVFTFKEQLNNSLLLKLSTSSVSLANAKQNLVAEIPGWDFEKLKNDTQNAWGKELSVIEVQDSSVNNKIKFYTALYHSLLIPWVISDINGLYLGHDSKVHKSEVTNHYNIFSPWDTFRSLHPLLCLIAPKRQNEMIISMLEEYKQTGKLPIEPMTGYHSIPIIVDSYFKNIKDFDKTLAYQAMKNLLYPKEVKSKDLEYYILKGFVPSSYTESVTRTVEYAYDDWALSRFAKEAMQLTADYKLMIKRSLNYRNLFDPEQLFLVPRGKNGFVYSEGNFGYKEGDKWNYSLFVPHNMRDIINLKGGNIEFTNHLDSALKNQLILFDNEPNFHIPYLFNFSKSPFKTQEWVAKIRDTYFTANANGLPGNDDLGSMSSWFVFNALGFFPVCPGVPEYNIGTPLFEKVILHNKNGNNFIVRGLNSSVKNKYIQEVTLNGENFNHSWLNHSEIEKGGEIIFSLGSDPSSWADHPQSEAFSLTKKESVISIDSVWLSKSDVDPNELFKVIFRLKNYGNTGVKIIRLFDGKNEIVQKNVLVEKDKSVLDSVYCKLFKSGIRKIDFGDSSQVLTVNVRKSNIRQFEISKLSFSPFLKIDSSQKISYYAKNIGGAFDSIDVPIYINNKLFGTSVVEAKPGTMVEKKYEISDLKTGINKIQVKDLTGVFKVYSDNKNATLVDLCFNHKNNEFIEDKSGFSNNGIIKTTNSESIDFKGFNKNSYVEIKNSPEFSFLKNEITVMAWVKLSKVNNYPISVITQGDHNVIQFLNKNTIQFFAGGWGRGECNAVLKFDLQNEWHHLAGVANDLSLKLYVDGKLIKTVTLNNDASLATAANWNLGRNEEFPGQRIFNGKLDGVKIFSAALSQHEIIEIVNAEKNNK